MIETSEYRIRECAWNKNGKNGSVFYVQRLYKRFFLGIKMREKWADCDVHGVGMNRYSKNYNEVFPNKHRYQPPKSYVTLLLAQKAGEIFSEGFIEKREGNFYHRVPSKRKVLIEKTTE